MSQFAFEQDLRLDRVPALDRDSDRLVPMDNVPRDQQLTLFDCGTPTDDGEWSEEDGTCE